MVAFLRPHGPLPPSAEAMVMEDPHLSIKKCLPDEKSTADPSRPPPWPVLAWHSSCATLRHYRKIPLRRAKGFGALATVQAIKDGRCGISLVANGTNERHARVAGVMSPVGARDFWWAIQDLNL